MISNKLYFLLGLFLIGSSFSLAQTTVGLRQNSGAPEDGYTLFSPLKNNHVYLIDNCGEVINTWEFNENPGSTCYLLENGNLLRAGKDSLQIRDWDNNVVWTFGMNANNLPQHHDIQPLPNGNILCIIADTYPASILIDQGRDPNFVGNNVRLERIVELQPSGSNQASIVWDWRLIDHLIQDFDANKQNYGVVEDHPELWDINYNNLEQTDWVHFNSVDYNEDLDQIILSSRHLSELYIIDHSTTTIQAGGHTGGQFNKGGDILWRWGNPQVYRQGTASDQQLFRNHDGRWIADSITNGGSISVFNNDGDGSAVFSSIHILTPQISNNEYVMANNKFEPQNYDWTWQGDVLGETFRESKRGGLQILANNHKLFTQSNTAQITELDENDDVIWVYTSPHTDVLYNQGDVFAPGDNTLFRGDRYPSNYIGFTGKDMTPNGTIEDQNNLTADCNGTVSIEEETKKEIQFENPIQNKELKFMQTHHFEKLEILSLDGKLMFKFNYFSGNKAYLSSLETGVYILRIQTENNFYTEKILVQ